MSTFFKYFSIVITVTALLTTAGCVTKTDMETLQIERQQDLNRIKQLEEELEESKQLLKDEIEKSQSPVRERTADTWADLQALRSDFAKLRGEIDMVNLRMDRQIGDSNSTISMETLGDQLDEIVFVLENQLQVDMAKIREERAAAKASTQQEMVAAMLNDNATTASLDQGATDPVAQKEAAKTEAPAPEADPAKALYDKAYALYKESQFEKARSYWAEFTDTFKGHPYTASAFFWQGQCYYKLRDYARAAILFEDVIEKFKKSSKYKSALLKAGYCWSYLKKPELAKMRMSEVVDKFPKSVEATQAKRFLEKNQ